MLVLSFTFKTIPVSVVCPVPLLSQPLRTNSTLDAADFRGHRLIYLENVHRWPKVPVVGVGCPTPASGRLVPFLNLRGWKKQNWFWSSNHVPLRPLANPERFRSGNHVPCRWLTNPESNRVEQRRLYRGLCGVGATWNPTRLGDADFFRGLSKPKPDPVDNKVGRLFF